jgi:hypothetical protein
MKETEARKLVSKKLMNLLKSENVTYKQLAQHLTDAGFPITESAIKTKLHRGSFSAGFLISACEVLGHHKFDWS